jgi:hypothetical protein
MRIQSVGALLLLATSSFAQLLSPAVPLTNTRYSTSGEAALATLATNGRTFIAAWSTPTGIRVSRIDGKSARIGVPIGGPTADAPALAAHGAGYVVGWTDGIRFLDANGEPASDPISIGEPTPRARIASNGSTVMLAYPRAGFQSEVLGAFIAASGEVLQKGVRLGTNATLTPPLPFAIAADKNGFAFVSEDLGQIRLKFFDTEGNFRSSAALDGVESGVPVLRYMAVAGSGRDFLVVWSTEERSLIAAQYRSDGSFITKVTLIPPLGPQSPQQPALAYDGESYLCTYLDGSAVKVIRISAVDLSITPTSPLNETAPLAPSVAAANSVGIVAWPRRATLLNNFGTGGVVFARSVSTDGVLGDTFPVSAAAQDQTFAASASNGTDILVTWIEGNGQELSLMAGLLRSDGAWLELGRLGSGGRTAPLVASNGHDFLVVGVDGAFRVSAIGEVLDRIPIGLGPFAATGLTWSGHDYIAVGELNPFALVSPGLGIVSISSSGTAGTLRNIRPPLDGDRAERPVVVSNGDELLVTYTWWEPPCFFCFFPVPSGSGARALRLSQSFEAKGPEIKAYPADAVLSTPLAWNGSEYLALAVDYYWVDAVRLARDGTVLGRSRLNASDTAKTRLGTPSVIATGSDFVVTWREVGSPGTVASGDAWVTTVHADGTSTPPVAFDQGGLSTGDPLLVLDQSGKARIIRPLFLSDPPYYGAERLVIHSLGTETMPEAPSLEIAATGSGALLSWSEVRGARGYRIESRNTRHDWKEVESWLGPESRSFPVVFDRGGVYQFRVKAIGWGGASYSNVTSYDPTRRRSVR